MAKASKNKKKAPGKTGTKMEQKKAPAPKAVAGSRASFKNTPHKNTPHTGTPQGPSGKLLTPLASGNLFLYSRNAIEAALKNKARECLRLIGTDKALAGARNLTRLRPGLALAPVSDPTLLDRLAPPGAPHQGLLLEVRPLPGRSLDDFTPLAGQKNILLMLDQVNDPHNVGACLRSAAALGARALITQDRHTPGETGVLARSAAGALETLPWVRTPNLAQALDRLKDMGYWSIGLAGDTDLTLNSVQMGDNIVIVMGSEGKGLRPLVRKHCDTTVKIPMTDKVESLNVSNAAAIALYQLGFDT